MKRLLILGTVMFAFLAFGGTIQAATSANKVTYSHVQKGEKHKKAKHHKKPTKTSPSPKQ